MLGDTAQYGKVYQILNQTCVKYFDKANANAFFIDQFKADLKKAGNEAWKENHAFPFGFFAEAGTVIVHWFDEGFKDLSSPEQVTEYLQQIWKAHRKYLVLDSMTEEAWNELLSFSKIAAERPTRYAELLLRALENIKDLDKLHEVETGT